MKKKLIIHVDENHPFLIEGLNKLGYKNDIAYYLTIEKILNEISNYTGLIIRSRFKIDKKFIDFAENLKFIARVGSGTENIDTDYAKSKGIQIINAPEGNKNAVGEHSLAMLLSLTNNLRTAHTSIQKGEWNREKYRGFEIKGNTVGIIGYGNMGKSFAKKLRGFNSKVICYDIKKGVGDKNAKQVSLNDLMLEAKIISIHVPQTPETFKMINKQFIDNIRFPFWIINTARGNVIDTDDLVEGLKNKKILGAGLDVLEYESTSFKSIFNNLKRPQALNYLLNSDNVLLSPHIGGLSFESNKRLAKTIIKKIKKI
jgi:D-3-phosphoglycerate dehydrogenase